MFLSKHRRVEDQELLNLLAASTLKHRGKVIVAPASEFIEQSCVEAAFRYDVPRAKAK
jgi:hypothetical protein